MTKTRVELFFLLILSKLNDKWVLLNSRKLTWTWWILVNKPDCFQIQPTRLRFRNPIALHIPFKSRVYVRKVLLHSSGIEFPVWINRSNLHSHFVTARVWIKAIFILPLGLTLCFFTSGEEGWHWQKGEIYSPLGRTWRFTWLDA